MTSGSTIFEDGCQIRFEVSDFSNLISPLTLETSQCAQIESHIKELWDALDKEIFK